MDGHEKLVPRALRWSVVGFAGYALLGGGLTLVGWLSGLSRLTDWLGSGISMFPNAALAALCSGAALILSTLKQRWSARASTVLGGVVALLGSATLFQHLSGIDLGLDTMLIHPAWGTKAAVAPGRMGPPASTSYTLIGFALLLIVTGRGRVRRIVPVLGILVCAIAMLALMGYASGADPLFAVARFTGIAMQTASILLALGLAVVARAPEYEPMRTLQQKSAAGLLARRSLPFIIGLPFLLGWLRVRAQLAGWFDTGMGTALLILALVTIFCALLWWWVGTVAESERALEGARDLLATTVASIGDAVIVTDDKGNITFLNAEAERLTGWRDSEARGQALPRVFQIINEQTRQPAENPVAKVFRTGKVAGLANHTLLISKDGRETPIDDSAAPIRDSNGPLFGVVLVFRDVTEQRKAQQAATRLAAIIEHSGDAIFTKNVDGIIQTWNPSAERLFGYRAEEIVGKPVTVLLPPDRLSEEDRIIEGLRQGHSVERLETIRIAKDGRRIPVSVSVSPLKNGDGEVIGASKIIHDVSEVVAAREALVREKELLATTLASIGDAVIVTDSDGRVTYLNPEAERLTKWSNAAAAGQPLPAVFRIINEATGAPVENPVEKVLRLGGVVGLANHTVLIAKDGTETPIDDSAAPIRQPGGPLFGVVLVFRDFTERKKIEAKLSADFAALTRMHTLGERALEPGKGHELLQEIMDAAVAILKADKGTLQLFEDGALRIVAHHAHERPFLDFFAAAENVPSVCGEATRRGERVIVADIERSETFQGTVSLPVLRAAGVRAVQSTPLLGRGGKLLGVLTTQWAAPHLSEEQDLLRLDLLARQAADLIEHNRAEEELREAQRKLLLHAADLEATVAERTAKLQETINELQSFSYSIAHDMRAPLRAMGTFAQLLMNELPAASASPETKAYCERIVIGAARLDNLINDALNYTKAVLQDFPLQSVDLSKLIPSLMDTYPNLQTDAADIQLEGNLPIVLGNESLLTQCFSNLLGNAVKFVGQGVRPKVRVWSEAKGGAARIWVEDNGIGIPKHAQPRLFSMFQKLDNQYEGTGIGLAIVRKVVERMGGKVGVESELERGSRFWIELRVAPKKKSV